MEKNESSINDDIKSPPTPQIDEKNRFSIEIKENNNINLELENQVKSLIISIIDPSNIIPLLFEVELDFAFFTEKDKSLEVLKDITGVFDFLKNQIENKKFAIKKENKDTYSLHFEIQYINTTINLKIDIPKRKLNPDKKIEQLRHAIVSLEKKINEIEINYKNDLMKQNEKLGVDSIINTKPSDSFKSKNEEYKLDIELLILNGRMEINFIENKKLINEKYSLKLSLDDFYQKDDYFKAKKNIEEIFNFIKLAFEKNKYKIKKENENDKEDKFILLISFFDGFDEKIIDFNIEKTTFNIVESNRQYIHSINRINEKFETKFHNIGKDMTNLSSEIKNCISEKDNNLKDFNTYKTQNDEKIKNLINDLDSFKNAINEKINENNKILKEEIKQQILETSHPVGSYYWSQKESDPSGIIGGKWEPIKGKFLYSVDDQHKVDSTGGEESVTLTVENIPAHNHGLPQNACVYQNVPDVQIGGGGDVKKLYENVGNIANTNNTGGGKPLNNMPPYICAFCWRRIE